MYRRLILISGGILALYLLLFIGDVLTRPAITEPERTLAHQYLATAHLATPPNAFSHDGCTGWPDRLLGHDFYEPCLRHDIAFWAGGTDTHRTKANRTFREDMKTTGPFGPFFAQIAYVGVAYFGDNSVSRIIGSNWGYGWNEE